jgi:hypothetical protein
VAVTFRFQAYLVGPLGAQRLMIHRAWLVTLQEQASASLGVQVTVLRSTNPESVLLEFPPGVVFSHRDPEPEAALRAEGWRRTHLATVRAMLGAGFMVAAFGEAVQGSVTKLLGPVQLLGRRSLEEYAPSLRRPATRYVWLEVVFELL